MKWLIIILTVLMIGCFEDESVQECGHDEVYNSVVKACVIDMCKRLAEPNDTDVCFEGCMVNVSYRPEDTNLEPGYTYQTMACYYIYDTYYDERLIEE